MIMELRARALRRILKLDEGMQVIVHQNFRSRECASSSLRDAKGQGNASTPA